MARAAAEKRQQAAEAEYAQLSSAEPRTAYLRQRLEEADRGVSRRRLDDYEAAILLINTRTETTLAQFRELRRERAR